MSTATAEPPTAPPKSKSKYKRPSRAGAVDKKRLSAVEGKLDAVTAALARITSALEGGQQSGAKAGPPGEAMPDIALGGRYSGGPGPTIHTPVPGFDTSGMEVGQPDEFSFPAESKAFEHPEPSYDLKRIMERGDVSDEQLSRLKFADEAVTVYIHPSGQEHGSPIIDCWVNGRGAEIYDEAAGKWVVWGFLPRGQVITTKRKYLEVIARARIETVNTKVTQFQHQHPQTKVERHQAPMATFEVRDDKSPYAKQWLERIFRVPT